MTGRRTIWRAACSAAALCVMVAGVAPTVHAQQRGMGARGGTVRAAEAGDRSRDARSAPLLSVDPASRTARYVVRAGLANVSQPELNFNGATMGELELRVPVGWTVILDFSNVGQASHSVRVVGDHDLPVAMERAAIAGAETPKAEQGTPRGGTHQVAFRAAKAGRYRLACAVPAHGFAGMWLRLTVDRSVAGPEVVTHEAATAAR